MQWMARPTRFPLELPVSYRNESGGEWQDGMTLEVSTSGAVMRMAEESTAPPAGLILVITLPYTDGCLVARGHIARSVAAHRERGTADFAVVIGEYQIVHRPAVAAATDSLVQPRAHVGGSSPPSDFRT